MNASQIIKKVIKEERDAGEFGKFDVFVGENEGDNIPHFHLEKDGKIKVAIRLDMPYYFIHGDKIYKLNSKSKKELIAWLNSKPDSHISRNKDGEFPNNNWENLRNIWNNYYPNSQVNCSIPNYSLLEKDYKEKIDQK